MISIRSLVVKLLREAADKIEIGTSEISDSQAMDLVSAFAHVPMSKESACSYLNMSRSRFDDLVRAKLLPKGRKRIGFKELSWYKDELDSAIKKIQENKKYKKR